MIKCRDIQGLSDERGRIAPSSGGNGRALGEAEVVTHDPSLVDELKSVHGLQVDAGAVSDAADFVQESRRPALDGGFKVRRLEQLLDKCCGWNRIRLFEVCFPALDELLDFRLEALAVGQPPLVGRPLEINNSKLAFSR